MKFLRLFVPVLLTISVGCHSEKALIFSEFDSDGVLTVIDKGERRFIFLGEVSSVKHGSSKEIPFIKLSTSKTTILSDAVFVCWGGKGRPVEVFCPNTKVLQKSSAPDELFFRPTDPEFAGQKFHSLGCFEYGYETSNIRPKSRAQLKR